jgi:predicted enzyme related to lactoylglutathione lyase
MPERDGYIPGVPCWIDTSQPDPDAAASFYGDLFGWEMEDVMPPDADGKYFIGRIRGGDVAAVSSIPEGAPPAAMWNTYIWVESADETASKARDAGGTVMSEPFDVMDSGRMAVFADPEGAVLCVWQAKEHKGAQVVNEHGSLNFNNLETRDPEGAKRFYGAVFGWETLALPGGAEMWTLPGYGDHLEQYTPNIRELTREAGGPEGFWDVVAAIVPLGDDEPDISAHWGVQFSVDDADVIAERATELGGRVVAPPVDLPWVRMTVIADPAGATFTAAKFVPENKDLAG